MKNPTPKPIKQGIRPMAKKDNFNKIIIFKTEDEKISVDVHFDDETVWLTQDQMSQLFEKTKSTINEHIKNIFMEGEHDEKVVIRDFRITTAHGAIKGKTQ